MESAERKTRTSLADNELMKEISVRFSVSVKVGSGFAAGIIHGL
jgi:hypothetical protein